MIVRFDGRTPQPRNFRLANRGNNNVDTVQFRLPLFDGAAAFLHLKTGGYSDVVRLADGIYTATRTHTQCAGRMEGWIEIQADGDQVWYSDVFVMTIGDVPNDGPAFEQQYPTAIEEALRAADMLTGAGASAESLTPTDTAAVRLEEDADGNRVLVFGIPRGVTFTPVITQMMDGATGERWLEIGWRNDGDMENPIIGRVRAPAGVGIAKVEQTTTATTPGGINVITVTLTNGDTYDFEVRNGSGTGGDGGGVDFEVDNETLLLENGVLRVNTTDKAESDNTQPITSAGVYTIVGNINAILKSI